MSRKDIQAPFMTIIYEPKGSRIPGTQASRTLHETKVSDASSLEAGHISPGCCLIGVAIPVPNLSIKDKDKVRGNFSTFAEHAELATLRRNALHVGDSLEVLISAVCLDMARNKRKYQLHIFPQQCSVSDAANRCKTDIDGIYTCLNKMAKDSENVDVKVNAGINLDMLLKIAAALDAAADQPSPASSKGMDATSPLAAASQAQQRQLTLADWIDERSGATTAPAFGGTI
jgi:hypothetical protein